MASIDTVTIALLLIRNVLLTRALNSNNNLLWSFPIKQTSIQNKLKGKVESFKDWHSKSFVNVLKSPATYLLPGHWELPLRKVVDKVFSLFIYLFIFKCTHRKCLKIKQGFVLTPPCAMRMSLDPEEKLLERIFLDIGLRCKSCRKTSQRIFKTVSLQIISSH